MLANVDIRPLAIAAVAALLLASVPAPVAAQPISQNKTNLTETNDRNYESMLRSNPSFRAKRMVEECGPIADPAAKQECLATFPPVVAPRARRDGQPQASR